MERVEPRPWRRWLSAGLVLIALLSFSGLLVLWKLRPRGPAETVPVADVSSQRLLPSGAVVGFAADFETHAWLGIPFARPPVGPLRWRAPEPPDAWADTRDALTFGPPCFQLASPIAGISSEDDDGFAGSEDCLTLNIWAPRAEPEVEGAALRPVMVWLHGGGNTRGAASLTRYDAARLAGAEDVVVVSIQYRLGPLGWFSHPALRSLTADPREASGNFGILDQIRALEWIRSNITEFGGDPGNVTIFGQSSGGTDVFALMLAEAAEGLFHRAIVQSGSTDAVSQNEAEQPMVRVDTPGHRHNSSEIVASLIESAGVVPDLSAARKYAAELPAADLADLIRSRAARDVLNAYRGRERVDSLEVPSPIGDGQLLPAENWVEAFRKGRFQHVPLIVGTTRDETSLMLDQDDEPVQRSFGFIYRIRDPAGDPRRAHLASELWVVRGVIEPATAMLAAGWGEIYVYRFDWDDFSNVVVQDVSQLIGAGDGFESPFLLGTFGVGNAILSRLFYPSEGKPERDALSRNMMSYWAEFARTGRPGRGGRGDLPEWLAWPADGMGESRLLVLDSVEGGGIRIEGPRS